MVWKTSPFYLQNIKNCCEISDFSLGIKKDYTVCCCWLLWAAWIFHTPQAETFDPLNAQPLTTQQCVYQHKAKMYPCVWWAVFVQFFLVRRPHCFSHPQHWPSLLIYTAGVSRPVKSHSYWHIGWTDNICARLLLRLPLDPMPNWFVNHRKCSCK